MSASKALTFLAIPPLLMALLGLTASPGEAVITQDERDACTASWAICADSCPRDCKGAKDLDACKSDCVGTCDIRRQNCLDEQDKTAPKRRPTMQPRPGGPKRPDIQQSE
jgi:hypothetical protein